GSGLGRGRGGPGLLAVDDVVDGEVTEGDSGSDGGAGAGVGVAHDRGRHIAGRVEPVDRGAVLAEYAGRGIGDQTTLGAEIAGHHLGRVERALNQCGEARVGLDGRVAVVAVVLAVAAVVVLVLTGFGELVEPFDGRGEFIGGNPDLLGQFLQGRGLDDQVVLHPARRELQARL